MPSGPKKRRAVRRRKQKMAISEPQSNSNSNPEPSPKEVEDENEEVFRTPTSEPEIPLSESESVYYSVEVKNHSRRGSSDDFKSLDFDDNTQERLNEFQLDEKDNLNVNFDDEGSREEKLENQREEPEEHKLNICTYVSEEELEASEQKMTSDDKNVKVLPWLGEAICTEYFITLNGSIDKASKEELHISADEKSEKVDLDMALGNGEISQDTITNVTGNLDDEKGISLTAQSYSSDKDFVEAIGFSPINVNNQEAGLWLDKEVQNIDSDENRDSKSELHRERPTALGNYIYLDMSGSAKDKCIKDMKLDEFLHVNDNTLTIDEDKLQIEVGQQIIEKSVPFDEKTALKALVETVAISPSKEREVKVVPWLYNDIPTEYVDVNVDVEVLRPEKEIAGFDSSETSNFCHEYDVSKCTPFESLDEPIQHISNLKIPKGILEVQRMLPQTDVELINNEVENSTEKSLGRENQQSITSNENPKDLSGGREMHPQIEADLISNEHEKSSETNSGLVDSSILVCDVKSLHEEDILSPIKSYKDSVQKLNTENHKDPTEIQEILPLTYVELIGNDLGKSDENSPVLVESSFPICEEEGLNMIATENSAEQEEDILSPIEISKDSVNIVNTENQDSFEIQEILPPTDVESISSDFSKPVEKSPGLVESSILTCEEEGLNVTAIKNSVEEEENIPFIESPEDSGNIYSTEKTKDYSAEVQEIPPQTEVELISNDLGKSVEKSSESSSLICEEEGLNVIATENLVEQEEDILTVIKSAKESAHTNQEIHHHTAVVLNSDELHETTENSSKYVENLTGEKEGLPFVNVEKLNKEIHIDTASSIDMVQEKLSSDSINSQSDETDDKCAGLDENYILNSEGMNRNGHDYLESLIGSNSVSFQPSMEESAEFSSNSEHTENMKKIEVAPKAVRPRTTIWNCCGLLEAFTSSDR